MTSSITEPTPERIWEITRTDPRVLAALSQWREATGQPAPTPMIPVGRRDR